MAALCQAAVRLSYTTPARAATARDGLPVTTVARTIADVARSGGAAEFVAQAVNEALDRGLVGEEELLEQAAKRGGRAKQEILAALAARHAR